MEYSDVLLDCMRVVYASENLSKDEVEWVDEVVQILKINQVELENNQECCLI